MCVRSRACVRVRVCVCACVRVCVCVCVCVCVIKYRHIPYDYPWKKKDSDVGNIPCTSWLIFRHNLTDSELGEFLPRVRWVSFGCRVGCFSPNAYYTHFWVCHEKMTAPVDLPGRLCDAFTKTWKWQYLDSRDFSRPPTIPHEMRRYPITLRIMQFGETKIFFQGKNE